MPVQEVVRDAPPARALRRAHEVRTVSLFRQQHSQAVCIPREFEFKGAQTVEIERRGDELVLRPVRRKRAPFISLLGMRSEIVPERSPIGEPEKLLQDFQ